MSAPDGLADRFQWFLSGEGRAEPAEREARLGAIAVQERYLTQDRLDECLRARAGRPLLEVAREKGFLTQPQVDAIVNIERLVSAETDTSSDPPPKAGARTAEALLGRSRLGRFRLLELLGEGGMGVVFRARDEELGRDVALKMLKTVQSFSAVQVERFQREARSVARLSHPGIVTIYEVGREGDVLYYTMELVPGRPLNEIDADLNARIRTLEKVARAVQYAHEQGVIHRDLKPPNILVDDEGSPRILDFGLSRDLGTTSGLSRTGAMLGTPVYMSPEQAEGRVHELDARTDVYALGVILYEALAGRVPFGGDTVTEVVHRSLTDAPKRPPGPKPLVAVCLKAMEKNPARRYPSAEAFADELARYLQGKPVHARPPGVLHRMRRWARHPAFLAGAGLLVAALAGWLLIGGEETPPTPLRPPARPAPPVVDPWKEAVRLLSRIDPAKDADAGIWKLDRGELVSDRSPQARIQVPYLLPQEYEARVTFTNRERDGMVACILLWKVRPFALVMNPRDSGASGFEIQGLDGSWQTPPAIHPANALKPDRKHVLIMGVKEGKVTVDLDGQRVALYSVRSDSARLTGRWSLKDKTVPGLGTSEGVTVFHSLEILETKGRGRPSR